MEKKIFPSQYSESTQLNVLSLVLFLWQPDSSEAELSVWVGDPATRSHRLWAAAIDRCPSAVCLECSPV